MGKAAMTCVVIIVYICCKRTLVSRTLVCQL